MKLGLYLGYSGSTYRLNVDLIKQAEAIGFDSVWTAEAYGSDAITPLAWIGAHTSRIKLGTAIMQMPARTPAATAMTAMTLDHLSQGRMLLGLGVSGPQVVEGWHGMAYGKPLARTREYVSIVRNIFKREQPVAFEGQYYQIPYRGEDATGLGKPLKSILYGRADLPIYLAANGEKNVQLTAEVADGWLPYLFSPKNYTSLFKPLLDAGFAKRGGAPAQFDIAPSVAVVVGDDVVACHAKVRPQLALYIGGMGAKNQNFYNQLIRRYGYDEPAENVQNLYLEGKKAEAEAALPDELIDELTLCGPKERIAQKLKTWQEIPIGTLIVAPSSPLSALVMSELVKT
jgi:F420-dependent oxidoreductase-like protein